MRKGPLVGLLVVLVTTGCGSRIPHESLVATWRLKDAAVPGAPASSAATPGPGPSGDSAGAATGAPLGIPTNAAASSQARGASDSATGTQPPAGVRSPQPAAGTGGSASTPVGASPGGAAPQGPTASGATGPQAGPGAAPAACTGAKAPITIGTVGHQSGILGSIFSQGPKTVQAWAASVNAAGGLKCHPVRYLIEDDGGDPSRHQAMIRKLVEQEKVLAIVQPDAPLTGQSSVSYLNDKQIPVVGSEEASDWVYTSPMFFPQATSGYEVNLAIIAAAADGARHAGKTKMANLTCLEAAVCQKMYEMAPRGSEFGMTVVYRAQASLAQPDFTSQCQAAQSAGAEVIVVTLDGGSLKRIIRSCNTVNYHPMFATAAQGLSDSEPGVDGVVLQTSTIPWFFTENPAVVEYLNVLKRYAPGLSPSGPSITGWVSAKLFELAAKQLSEPPTSASLLEGLWAVKDNDLGVLTQPLTFTRGQNAPRLMCYWKFTNQGSSFTRMPGGDRVCLKNTSQSPG